MSTQRTVWAQDRQICYTLEEKRVKNINLRVRPDGSVYVSAPYGADRARIDAFVCSKAGLILAAQQAQSAPARAPLQYQTGDEIQLLGRTIALHVIQGARDEAQLTGGTLLLRLRHPEDPSARMRLTERFIDGQCQAVFASALDAAFPPFASLGFDKPLLRIRDMKTRWGSCMPQKGVVTINRRLIQALPGCIRMVVTHELCHLMHPNHGAGFYDLLNRCMPDWSQYKAMLRQNAVQWLR